MRGGRGRGSAEEAGSSFVVSSMRLKPTAKYGYHGPAGPSEFCISNSHTDSGSFVAETGLLVKQPRRKEDSWSRGRPLDEVADLTTVPENIYTSILQEKFQYRKPSEPPPPGWICSALSLSDTDTHSLAHSPTRTLSFPN